MNIYSQGDEIAADASPHSRALRRLMDDRGLHAVYQPILDVRQGRHFACEALIRGPENSALHTPAALFAAAASERETCERSNRGESAEEQEASHLNASANALERETAQAIERNCRRRCRLLIIHAAQLSPTLRSVNAVG